MTDSSIDPKAAAGDTTAVGKPAKAGPRDIGIRRRRAAETRYKIYGIVAISIAVAMLITLLWSVVRPGVQGLTTHKLEIEFFYDPAFIEPSGQYAAISPEAFAALDESVQAEIVREPRQSRYTDLVRTAFLQSLDVDVNDSAAVSAAMELFSNNARSFVQGELLDDPTLFGQTVTLEIPLSGQVTGYIEGAVSRDTPEDRRDLSDAALDLIDVKVAENAIYQTLNWDFLSSGWSTRVESVGLGSAIIGSAFMMMIVLVVAVPIGVAASIYLEEFAPKNRFTDLIEVNINNLAAVPSIVFGLLGLAVFINFAGLPRSAPIVGGLVLSLMTLPTVIIATRAALKAVPPSIREAALGVGASKTQAVFHHVLPLALPGILTGTIIGVAQALGETAPLLIIGMSASVSGAETFAATPFDPAPALPTQIYMMMSQNEPDLWFPLASTAIIVLLVFLIVMNLTAVFLRRRFERKW